MSDNNGSDFGSFLAGFVIGGLVGGAVALVLAPKSGAETRSQISGKGREIVDAGEERYYNVMDSAEVYVNRAGERASQFSQDIEEQARIVLDEGLQGLRPADDNGSASSVEDIEDEA
ncbi:MAG: YtxH domain-containing protein [Anaerolineales bacterium]|jgi:gas vesicle protein